MKLSDKLGHCQVCGRIHVVLTKNGMMSLHGYSVIWNQFNNVCNGQDHKPLEVSREKLDQTVVLMRGYAVQHRDAAQQLDSGAFKPEKVCKRNNWGNIVREEIPNYVGRFDKTRPVRILWADASEFEQDSQVQADIAEHDSFARQCDSHADSLLELAKRVHGKPLMDRFPPKVAKKPAPKADRATGAISTESFPTKVSKKDALEVLSRLYRAARDQIQSEYLGSNDRSKERDDVYYSVPYDLHCWRAKHSAMVVKLYPQLADVVKRIEDLVVAREKIKAIPVIK